MSIGLLDHVIAVKITELNDELAKYQDQYVSIHGNKDKVAKALQTKVRKVLEEVQREYKRLVLAKGDT